MKAEEEEEENAEKCRRKHRAKEEWKSRIGTGEEESIVTQEGEAAG